MFDDQSYCSDRKLLRSCNSLDRSSDILNKSLSKMNDSILRNANGQIIMIDHEFNRKVLRNVLEDLKVA